jgi:hypothetical protein
MLFHDLIRMLMCLVFGFTAGVCLVRALAPRSTVRTMLFALAVASTALFASQLSLFGQPFTIRTAFSGAAAAGDALFMASLFRHGPPANPQP